MIYKQCNYYILLLLYDFKFENVEIKQTWNLKLENINIHAWTIYILGARLLRSLARINVNILKLFLGNSFYDSSCYLRSDFWLQDILIPYKVVLKWPKIRCLYSNFLKRGYPHPPPFGRFAPSPMTPTNHPPIFKLNRHIMSETERFWPWWTLILVNIAWIGLLKIELNTML